MTLGVNAQDYSNVKADDYAEKLATTISQELNFDDSKTLYLYKALKRIEQTRKTTEKQLGGRPNELKVQNQRIDETFNRMLSVKFSESEIVAINQLISKAK
jgi:hypothetical protein